MKQRIVVLFLLSFSSLIFGQWRYISQGGLFLPIYTIQAVSPQIVWALGEQGLLYKSTDGGQSWVLQKPNLPITLNRMLFLNEMTGYISGNTGRLWKTTDGGFTWNYQILHAGLNMTTIQFLTSELGFVSAHTSEILKTTNGGLTWTHIPVVAGSYRTMQFFNEQIGIISYDNGKTVRTTDGGLTWLTAATGFSFASDYIRDIQWLKAGTALATDANGRLFITADTGRTWQQKTVAASFKPVSVHFIDSLNGYILDRSTKTARTTDGGQSFIVSSAPGIGSTPGEIFVYDTSRVFIAGPSNGTHRTTNGGLTWESSYTQDEVILNNTVSTDEYDAVVVGNDGVIGDASLFWNTIYRKPSGTKKNLYGVGSISAERIIAVGESGVVAVCLTSSLNSWTIKNTGYPNTLYSVATYPSSNTVFACGEGGIILRSTTFGGTWELLSSGVTSKLNLIKYFTATTIMAVGDNGVMLQSTNNGDSWQQLQLNTNAKLFSFAGGASNRLVCGENGLLLRSSDNGATWHRVALIDSADITGVASGGPNSARLVTRSGVIYNTTNSGQSWSRELINPAISIRSLQASSWTAMSAIYNKTGLLAYRLPVPVELTSFTASVSEKNITLNWSTATETNNRGFEIQRSADNETWLPIGFKQGVGTTTEPSIYSFSDQNPLNGINYYRLKQTDYDGTEEILQTVSVKFYGNMEFSIHQNYPNPFNPATTISYSLPLSGLVQLKIYNTTGEEVASLVNELQDAGSYQISFNGSGLASGTYLYRITVNSDAGVYTQSRKMVILK